MNYTPMQQESIRQVVRVTRYLMALPQEEQFSEIQHIILGGVRAIERQDVSGLKNTIQVAAIHAEASALMTVPGRTTEGMRARGSQEMTVVTTEHPHIIRDPMLGSGEPIIVGTGVRVRILVEYWRAGTPPEELLQAFPHLTLAQVFDALSYYQDHQPEMNALIEQNRVDPALLHESTRRRS